MADISANIRARAMISDYKMYSYMRAKQPGGARPSGAEILAATWLVCLSVCPGLQPKRAERSEPNLAYILTSCPGCARLRKIFFFFFFLLFIREKPLFWPTVAILDAIFSETKA